jgi:RNA polymerase sigma factor (sigma-70 family)
MSGSYFRSRRAEPGLRSPGEPKREPPADGECSRVAGRSFEERFAALFEAHFPSLYRSLHRLSGEADLAADLAQEAFIRLYRRGMFPDAPKAWLITVALNLLRNERTTQNRRRQLLTAVGGFGADSAPPSAVSAGRDELRHRVRVALDRLPDRERRMLVMHSDGYSYHDIAAALQLNEASVGTLLARARRQFRSHYEGGLDASR